MASPEVQAQPLVSWTCHLPSVDLLGVRISAIRLPQVMAAVSEAVIRGGRLTLFYVNVHCMNVARDNATYRHNLNRADVVYCDGTGVRLGARLLGLRIPERMTGADWIHDLCRLALADGYSLFFLGGELGVAEDAARVLCRRYSGLRVVGTHAGYDADDTACARIAETRPDIVLVGMGTPRQEEWIRVHREELDVPVVWGVGALFDFVAGRIPRGPRWMTEHGLEWLCRLATEPRKLWRRYLIGNPRFLWRVLEEVIRCRFVTSTRPRGT